jgi:hypothetical protein
LKTRILYVSFWIWHHSKLIQCVQWIPLGKSTVYAPNHLWQFLFLTCLLFGSPLLHKFWIYLVKKVRIKYFEKLPTFDLNIKIARGFLDGPFLAILPWILVRLLFLTFICRN